MQTPDSQNSKPLRLHAAYAPAGDQPQAIAALTQGLQAGESFLTLVGVTGSGKTYTLAQVIAQLQRPALVMAHNKTLAAQLYGELRAFFPDNAVEYFVSYYDYYQPEAYLPGSDTYIEKDSAINDHIEQMRLSATKALLERRDCIIVASVSAIYGLGDPQAYLRMVLHLNRGMHIVREHLLKQLVQLQYTRNDLELSRGTYRVRGPHIDIFPAEEEAEALRLELEADELLSLHRFDPLTGKRLRALPRYTLYPKTHFATPREQILKATDGIRAELTERLAFFQQTGKLLEAQRLQERTAYDLELLTQTNFCRGIENYSRHLDGRAAGTPPATLFDYLPADGLLVLDESHVTLPQIQGMYRGDQARKQNLVDYGFRLPSALDNRPLKFEEFIARAPQTLCISATPGPYERQHSSRWVEQLLRPTGLLDPVLEVRPTAGQVENLGQEIRQRIARQERTLVTVLTKRLAENLTQYLKAQGLRVQYLHADIDTVERVEILRDLRLGKFDVLVGINLLREGLDLPEVSLVAILDADQEGFLRSESALIQTIGRAARHINGQAILYADRTTPAMQYAQTETRRRRALQAAHNAAHGIIPRSAARPLAETWVSEGSDPAAVPAAEAQRAARALARYPLMPADKLARALGKLEKAMYAAARKLEFTEAARLRDQIHAIETACFGAPRLGIPP